MNLPKISCICPTFSRAALLEEAIESFIRQDYKGEKELIICNDYPRQTLIYEDVDKHNIRVINYSSRFDSLGEKRNASASHGTGEYLLTWGDDDIHLPNRISRMVNAVMNTDHKMFIMEGAHYCLHMHVLNRHKFSCAGPHIISKDFFWKLGGIPPMNMGEDQRFNAIILEHLKCLPVCNDDPAFIYRWAHTNRPHISAFGEDKNNPISGYEKMLIEANRLVELGKEPCGEVVLSPNWSKDWVEFAKTAIDK